MIKRVSHSDLMDKEKESTEQVKQPGAARSSQGSRMATVYHATVVPTSLGCFQNSFEWWAEDSLGISAHVSSTLGKDH